MNIFFLHANVRRCARWHCNKHVVKMLLESCQLLYTAHWSFVSNEEAPDLTGAPVTTTGQRGYKPTHRHHPCAKWVRASLAHYRWLAALAAELAREYRHRYGATKTHACEAHVAWLASHPPAGLKDVGWTPPPSAMPDEFKISTDPVKNYRNFYTKGKGQRGLLEYKGRHVPHWIPKAV